MFKIKCLLLSIVFSMIAAVNLSAQDDVQVKEAQSASAGQRVKLPKKSAEQKATALTDTLSSVVGLSADQYQKAYTANLKYLTQKESLKKNNTGDFQAIKEQMKIISKTRKSEIAAILTPEQITKWQAWKQARKEQGLTKKDQFMQNHPNAAGKIQQYQNNKQGADSEPMFDDIGDM